MEYKTLYQNRVSSSRQDELILKSPVEIPVMKRLDVLPISEGYLK